MKTNTQVTALYTHHTVPSSRHSAAAAAATTVGKNETKYNFALVWI